MMRRASSASSGVHRDAHLAQLVDGERKHRRAVTADDDDRRHAVGFEQAAHDAGFDVGAASRKMMTSSLTSDRRSDGHRRAGGRVERRVVDPQQDHRHVVVLRRVADKRLDLAQDALAQLVRRQVGVLLEQVGRAGLRRSSRRWRSSPR